MSSLTLRIDAEVERALAVLTRDGISRSEATRAAILEAERLNRRARIRAEAESLRNDPEDVAASRALAAEMADTTTVKVRRSTRELLLKVGTARHESADQVIVAALAAMTRDDRRRIAAAEALALRDDPADLAEVRAIQHDMAALHEG